jgi:adenylosuccinate synthase
MPVTIVVGGQYGSEGKGKVVTLLSDRHAEPWIVRCGGPNSGHSTCIDGRETVLRQLPAAAGHPGAMLFLSAGCVVSEEVLIREIQTCGIPRDRIVVDPRAVLVSPEDILAEQGIAESIGSTASGTGAALVRRMQRTESVRLVNHSTRVREYARVEVVAESLHQHIDNGGQVIVEGTQGFGLSLLHGCKYPFVTSRDTTAAAFASEVGLSPRQVDEIVMVIRTFPIRVGGNSGDLPNEITWELIRDSSGAPNVEVEYTSVSKRIRRVGEFDINLDRRAALYNRPTLGTGPATSQAFFSKAQRGQKCYV